MEVLPLREHDPVTRKAVGAVCLSATALIALVAVVNVVRYALLGSALSLVNLCLIEVLLLLVCLLAWQSRLPALLLAVAVPGVMLGVTTNSVETGLFNLGFFIQAGVALIAAVAGTVLQLRHKTPPRRPRIWTAAALAVVLVGGLAFWQGSAAVSRSAQTVGRDIWAVPDRFSRPCERGGTVEELTYQTKAYATDQREVEKTAYVYLPAGYDPEEQYNILYLLHGTGDNERAWLVEHGENKDMVDQLIDQGIIEPLIIVTPTFYVEDDCAGELDQLTYSFAQELRNDLMPAVESRYSTYAPTCDEAGFTESRDHRAFAGLSRGAVTTYHSALCGSLDYFSWFGAFSGSRTSADYFRETIQSEAFGDYPIHYLYVSSGTLDFALPGQLQDYAALLDLEPRLTSGVNTNFDVFPMQSHSWESWHLALYNFLQKVF